MIVVDLVGILHEQASISDHLVCLSICRLRVVRPALPKTGSKDAWQGRNRGKAIDAHLDRHPLTVPSLTSCRPRRG